MRKITLPDWVKRLPDNARVRASEVKAIFGYSETTGVSYLVRNGYLPKPTAIGKGFTASNFQWSVADLKKYERECKIVVDQR